MPLETLGGERQDRGTDCNEKTQPRKESHSEALIALTAALPEKVKRAGEFFSHCSIFAAKCLAK